MIYIPGLFQLHDSRGFPLSMSLNEIDKAHRIDRKPLWPDWLDFFQAGRKAGWIPDRIWSLVKAEMAECFWCQRVEDVQREIFTRVTTGCQWTAVKTSQRPAFDGPFTFGPSNMGLPFAPPSEYLMGWSS